jgi:cysteine desulfurase/selenocysteine lyase
MVASNVTGRINKLPSSLLRRRSDVEAPAIIRDATAAVGHMPIDVQELGADYMFFSGHKMCGPTGVGVLYGRNELLEKLEPGCVGGGMVTDVEGMDTTWAEGPGRFEPGTQNIAGVLGIAAAAEYLDAVGLEVIRTHAQALVAYAQTLLGELPGVTLYSAPPQDNVGIVSFTVEGIHPHDVAEVAGMEGVALRAGHHCALPLHKTLGVEATTRASVYLYNTRDDIDALVASIKKAQEVFKK